MDNPNLSNKITKTIIIVTIVRTQKPKRQTETLHDYHFLSAHLRTTPKQFFEIFRG